MKNTKVKFIKIAKYDTKYFDESISNYKFLCDLTLQKTDVESLEKNSLKFETDVVLHSGLDRAKSCIHKVDGENEFIEMKELNEVKFDMGKMCTEGEWKNKGSKIVREKFIEFFIHDKLEISLVNLEGEIKIILEKIGEIIRLGKSVSILSHSFKLKILEAYIKSDFKLFENRNLIKDYIFSDKKTYEFGEGFELNIVV